MRVRGMRVFQVESRERRIRVGSKRKARELHASSLVGSVAMGLWVRLG